MLVPSSMGVKIIGEESLVPEGALFRPTEDGFWVRSDYEKRFPSAGGTKGGTGCIGRDSERWTGRKEWAELETLLGHMGGALRPKLLMESLNKKLASVLVDEIRRKGQ